MIDPMTNHLAHVVSQERLAAAKVAREQANWTSEPLPLAKLWRSPGGWLIACSPRKRRAGTPARSFQSLAEHRQ